VAKWIPLGEKHRKERIAEGISLRARAAALGITAARLSAMETGRADPAMLEELE
jgi:transcriptional regulator with XRE-family HTH domain